MIYDNAHAFQMGFILGSFNGVVFIFILLSIADIVKIKESELRMFGCFKKLNKRVAPSLPVYSTESSYVVQPQDYDVDTKKSHECNCDNRQLLEAMAKTLLEQTGCLMCNKLPDCEDTISFDTCIDAIINSYQEDIDNAKENL